MKISSIDTYALSIPRETVSKFGGAGSPAPVRDRSQRYSLAKTYGTVYGTRVETMLVKITTTDGIYGWGEAQSPIVPEVTQGIIHGLIAPLMLGMEDPTPIAVRDALYNAMRVRGHSGGFYIDAVSAIDCALWDIVGKAAGQPVCRMLGGPTSWQLPTYVSGLTGDSPDEKLQEFDRLMETGARAIKVFLSSTVNDCLALIAEMRRRSPAVQIFVDALWRLGVTEAIQFTEELKANGVGWLEAPLMPEDVEGHRQLAQRSHVRIALGESYRTGTEILPLLQARAMEVMQPDIGRSGITEAMHMATLARAFHAGMAPHISIGLGPQIAAALHVSACWPHLEIVECNPTIYSLANTFLASPLRFSPHTVAVPDGPGLGIDLNETELTRYGKTERTTH